jgi:RNA polymerase sigma-70 factor (ECF subfamily)
MYSNSEVSMNTNTFKTVALAHIDSVYRLALYMAGNEDDAQNLVRNTYLKAYKSFTRFEAETICKAWLLGILKNTFVSSARDCSRNRRGISLPEWENSRTQLPGDTDDEVPRDGFGDEILAGMNELPVQYGAVLLLADVEGLPYKEIAGVIGCSKETVMSRLCKGRRLLGRRLRDKQLSDGSFESMEFRTGRTKLKGVSDSLGKEKSQ